MNKFHSILIGLLLSLATGASAREAPGSLPPKAASPLTPEVAAEAAGDPKWLVLAAGAFDPLVERLDGESLGFPRARPGRYGVVQFRSSKDQAEADLSALGAEVVGYLPHNAWIVRWSPEGRRQVGRLAGVRWSGEFEPVWKVSPDLLLGAELAPQEQVNVVGFRGGDLNGVEETLLAAFPLARVGSKVLTGPQPQIRFRLASEDLEEFVRRASTLDEVAWLERWRLPELHNHNSVSPIQNNATTGTPIWDQDLIGTGQIVAVADSGLDRNQCWFTQYNDGILTNTEITDAENLTPPATGSIFPQRKVVAYWVAPGATAYDNNQVCTTSPTSFHGTHTTGTVLGDRGSVATPTDPAFLATDRDGMAPNAQVLFQDVGNDTTGCLSGLAGDLGLLFEQAWNGGARLHSNSWGAAVGGAYTATSQQADAAAWRLEDLLIFFSAGNNGPGGNTIGAPGTAKNVVTVGALGNGNSTSVASFSSRGPTDDGRIKPDIMAPGSSIVSAAGDTNNTTPSCPTNGSTLSGTSMACPTVAGGAALLRQYFMDGFYPSGSRTATDVRKPSGALMKAVLLNGTRDLSSMPNNNYGWGRIWLNNNLFFSSVPGDRRLRVWSRAHEVGIVTGDTHAYTIQVPAGSELRVTLVWMDPYPSLNAGIQLVNNLNLEVEGPGGVIYRGNVFAGGQSTTGGSADALNTVEQVRLVSPPAGTYTIRVIGANVPGNGDAYTSRQGYGLAASFGNCSGAVASAPANVVATDLGAAGVQVTWYPVSGASTYLIYRANGNCTADPASFDLIGTTATTSFVDSRAQGGYTYAYKVRAADGCAEGPISACSSASATGSCDRVPTFDPSSLSAVDLGSTPACDIQLSWNPGTSNCPLAPTVTYNVYRSTQHDFVPGPATLLAGGVAGTSFVDTTVQSLTTYHYAVRAQDSSTPPNEHPGTRRVKATATGGGVTVGTFADGGDGTSLMVLESPWQLTSTQAAQGSLSYHNAEDNSNYPPDTCAAVVTPPLELRGGGTPILSYSARWNLESQWDGVVVEISTDGGATWTDLPPSGGYPSNFGQTGNPPINACGYPATQGAFSGSSGGIFQTRNTNLAAYAGQTVRIRWRFSSDPGAEEAGFFLDHVTVTNATTPYPCGGLFLDSFETGDTSEWSATSP